MRRAVIARYLDALSFKCVWSSSVDLNVPSVDLNDAQSFYGVVSLCVCLRVVWGLARLSVHACVIGDARS